MNKFLMVIYSTLLFFILSCSTKGYKRGGELYEAYCSDCHMSDGSGLEGLYPPINDSDYIKKHKLDLVCIIRYGFEKDIMVKGKSYNQKMNGFPKIAESDIANIVNYINFKFLNNKKYVNINQIKEALSKCEK